MTATKLSTETADRHLASDLRSVAAVLLVVIAAVVVAMGYRQHVADVGQLNDRAPSLDYLGSSSTSRTWTPIPRLSRELLTGSTCSDTASCQAWAVPVVSSVPSVMVIALSSRRTSYLESTRRTSPRDLHTSSK